MNKATILIVDDEDAIRFFAGFGLGRAGWQVQEASTGEAALAWLFGLNPVLGDRRPIDLIRLGRTEELMRAIRAERSDAFQ